MKDLEVLLIGSFSQYLQGFTRASSCICINILMYGVYHIDIDIHLPYLNQPDSRAILGGSATTTWMMDVHATQKKAMICS